jgi:hypothetical protein
LSLAVPLIAAVRARRHPFAAPALGVYAAFLVHAGVDWDFELAGVTLVALLAAGALVVLARGERPPQRIAGWVRPCAIAVSSLLAALAVWSLLVNVPLGRAREAAGRSDWSTGLDEAKKASRWAPWASDPWRLRGDGEVALGRVVAARRSYRTAVVKDPREWLLWLKLALVSSGPQKLEALERARVLNPKNERVRMIEAAARNRERRS